MKGKMLMDKIKLSELTVNTVIGIWDWEKRNPQKVVFDIEISTDISKASKSDLIKDALDYKACLLYTSPSPRDISGSRMPSSA